jgi:hypothetical protein
MKVFSSDAPVPNSFPSGASSVAIFPRANFGPGMYFIGIKIS